MITAVAALALPCQLARDRRQLGVRHFQYGAGALLEHPLQPPTNATSRLRPALPKPPAAPNLPDAQVTQLQSVMQEETVSLGAELWRKGGPVTDVILVGEGKFHYKEVRHVHLEPRTCADLHRSADLASLTASDGDHEGPAV